MKAELVRLAAECAREKWEYSENEEFPFKKSELQELAKRAERKFDSLYQRLLALSESAPAQTTQEQK